jgi:hypothetical protein
VAIWERPSPSHQYENSGRGLLPLLLDLDKGFFQELPWATKIVIIRELSDPLDQYSTYFLSIHKDAPTSEAVFPPGRDVAVHFNFVFSSFKELFHFQCIRGALACDTTHAKVYPTSSLCPQIKRPGRMNWRRTFMLKRPCNWARNGLTLLAGLPGRACTHLA